MGVKIEGIKELKKALQEHQKFNKTAAMVVKLNGAELQQKAQRYAPVDTGTLRRSIWLGLKDSGMTAEVAATAEYAGYVEYGTRRMSAQPYMRPAFNEQKDVFIKDMERALKKQGG